MTRHAFIGLGSIGAPLATHIARAGHDLTVFDPFPDALAALEGLCDTAGSAAEAARDADILCICVRDDAQVRDVLFGENGAADALANGALVMIHSTIAVSALADIAARLDDLGIATVDAPVSRTRQTTDEPFVYTMLGGAEDAVGRVGPVVEAFSTDHSHMGPLGAGMATKIANNLITWTQIAVAIQGFGVALRSGVALEQLLGVMKANGNLTPTMGAIIAGKFQAPPSKERDVLMASQGGIGEKDLQLAIDTARERGIDTGMMEQAQAMIRGLMSDPAPQ
jgi:3-hydroxyisobutyrate dehydrogenase-like beta-hydroxyacid dehydrogenase